MKAARLTIQQILRWADDHQRSTGAWPKKYTGRVQAAEGESWYNINLALVHGRRGLPGGMTLPQLLAKHRGVPNRKALTPLSHEQVLAWADHHYRRTGRWPTEDAGQVLLAPNENWGAIANAMRLERRGLRGYSLHKLLSARRGVRNSQGLPHLTIEQILGWADDHFRRTGLWPTSRMTDPVPGTGGETWHNMNHSLTYNLRGLSLGVGLRKLLAATGRIWSKQPQVPVKVKVRRPQVMSARLTITRILEWADAHHRRTGKWPRVDVPQRRKGKWSPERDRRLPEAPDLSWRIIDKSLKKGERGLPGGSSLSKLLYARRGVWNKKDQASLKVEQILKWADKHHDCTGKWPCVWSGSVRGAPHETWYRIASSMYHGRRGLPRGKTLWKLLAEQRGVRNQNYPPRLTIKQILAWVDEHAERTGKWPTKRSGPVHDVPGESWLTINNALQHGSRGLRGGSSVAKLLNKYRRIATWEKRKSYWAQNLSINPNE